MPASVFVNVLQCKQTVNHGSCSTHEYANASAGCLRKRFTAVIFNACCGCSANIGGRHPWRCSPFRRYFHRRLLLLLPWQKSQGKRCVRVFARTACGPIVKLNENASLPETQCHIFHLNKNSEDDDDEDIENVVTETVYLRYDMYLYPI